MRRIGLLAAAFAACGVANAESMQDAIRRSQLRAESLLPVVMGAVPNACGSAPLPLTPVGPVVSGTFQYGSANAPNIVKAWRYPCSATASMIVLTVTPTDTSNPSFLCGAGMQLLQSGGLQTEAMYLRADPGTSNSFCSDVLSSVTLAIVPRSNTPAAFDFDQATTIDFDGATAGHQTIAIAAFNPAAYTLTPPPGPDLVDVYVHGTPSGFRNCTVSTAPSGSGTRYTASCASEVPLQANGFDRYPR